MNSKICRFQHGRADKFEDMIRRDSKKHQTKSKSQGESKIDANQQENLDQPPFQNPEIAGNTDVVTEKEKTPRGNRKKRAEATLDKNAKESYESSELNELPTSSKGTYFLKSLVNKHVVLFLQN